jgi:hypothetical protein
MPTTVPHFFPSFLLLLHNPFLHNLTPRLSARNRWRRGGGSKEAGSCPRRGRRDCRSIMSSTVTSTPRELRAWSKDKLLPLFLPQHDIRSPRLRRVRQNDLHVNKPVGKPSNQTNSSLPIRCMLVTSAFVLCLLPVNTSDLGYLFYSSTVACPPPIRCFA